jgi:hypothetical protein
VLSIDLVSLERQTRYLRLEVLDNWAAEPGSAAVKTAVLADLRVHVYLTPPTAGA